MAKKASKKPTPAAATATALRRAAKPSAGKKPAAPAGAVLKSARPAAKVGSASRPANHVTVPRPASVGAGKKLKGRKSDRGFGSRDSLTPMPPVVIPRPVTTDGKPRKNQAGLSTRELEHFRELLLAKRRELVGDMSSMEREALRSATGSNLSNLPLHMADMGTDNYEQEFTLGLVEKDRQLLREINRALAKILDGSYGICEGTGKPISKPRLEAQPWAKYSIEYARQMERGLGMIRR